MTLAYLCILICMLIPIYWAGVSKKNSTLKYNNNSPRDHLNQLSGKAKNAYCAEQNCYETFPPFVAAVIIAHMLGHNQFIIDVLAVSFVFCRVLHGVFYIQEKGNLRSISYIVGLTCVIALFFAG